MGAKPWQKIKFYSLQSDCIFRKFRLRRILPGRLCPPDPLCACLLSLARWKITFFCYIFQDVRLRRNFPGGLLCLLVESRPLENHVFLLHFPKCSPAAQFPCGGGGALSPRSPLQLCLLVVSRPLGNHVFSCKLTAFFEILGGAAWGCLRPPIGTCLLSLARDSTRTPEHIKSINTF